MTMWQGVAANPGRYRDIAHFAVMYWPDTDSYFEGIADLPVMEELAATSGELLKKIVKLRENGTQ